jgi:predicted ATPase
MIVIAARTQTEALAVLPTPANNIIPLAPLSEMGRRELIEHLLPGHGLPISLTERLSQESEGNPFYLIEATRAIIQSKQLVRQNGTWHLTRPESQIEMPQSIEGLMMASLDSLDPIKRSVLQHAAVIGSQFSYSLLKAITPIEDLDNCLDDLKQRDLIRLVSDNNRDTNRSFTFTHLAMRQVAYQSILRKTRRELHQRIAELAEAEASVDQEDLKVLARHYAAGGDQEKLIAYNWLAGQRALNEFNFEEAYQYLDLAWTTLQEMSSPNKEIFLNVAHALGDASTFTGKFTQAVICYKTLQESMGEKPEELAWAHYKLGRLYFYQAHVEKASEYYEQALKLAASSEILKSQIEAEIRLLYDIG